MRKALSLVALLAGCGLLAASALASARQAPPAGVFRIIWDRYDIDHVDPAFAHSPKSWTLMYATGAMLFNYPDAPAPRGSWLQPEVAAAFPHISRDGKTYTVRLKRTYRFSDGRPVTAASFAVAINRALVYWRYGSGGPFVSDIVGAKDVIAGRSPRARGVRILSPYRLRIRLERPASNLLARLAMPYFQAFPYLQVIPPYDDDAPKQLTPGAGPYSYHSLGKNGRVELRRNPHYRGPRPRRVNRIIVEVGTHTPIKRWIDEGRTDTGRISLFDHAELSRTHGIRHRSPGRYFVNPGSTVVYLAINHGRPLFGGPTSRGNVRLKRAVSYALDRTALLRTQGVHAGFGSEQLLPPAVRGYVNADIYPRYPDLSRARALAAGSTRGGKAVLWCARRWQRTTCSIVQQNLKLIGLDVRIVLQPRPAVCSSGRPEVDLVLDTYDPTLRDPAEFLQIVDGRHLPPPPPPGKDYCGPDPYAAFTHFKDATFARQFGRANSRAGVERYRALSKLERQVIREIAPVAVIGVLNEQRYVSERTGCYHHHPVYGFDLPAICLRP